MCIVVGPYYDTPQNTIKIYHTGVQREILAMVLNWRVRRNLPTLTFPNIAL